MTTITGTDGDDLLEGTSAADTISGGAGNDTLTGWSGTTVLQGEAGDDVLRFFNVEDISGSYRDTVDGGAGHDTLDLSLAAGGVNLTLWGNDASTNAGLRLIGIESIVGSAYDEFLALMPGVEIDEVNLGDGYDTVRNFADGVTVRGEAGNDALWSADDANDVTLDGGFDDDEIWVRRNTVAYGGHGNDAFYVRDTTGATISGGDGVDTFSIVGTWESHQDLTITDFNPRTEALDFTAGSLTDRESMTFSTDSNGNAVLSGSNFTITLVGVSVSELNDQNVLAFDRVVIREEGGGTLEGGAGDDYLYAGGADHDSAFENYVINGGDGHDYIFAGNGSQKLTGGAGNDTLRSGGRYDSEFDDTLDGGAGDDFMSARGGDDLLRPGDGDDLVYAGDGQDTIYAAGGGDDTLVGGGDNDLLGGGVGDDFIVGDDHVPGSIGVDLIGHGGDTIYGGAGDDTLLGGSWANSTFGTPHYVYVAQSSTGAANVIWAGDGNDIVYGDGGNDSIGGGVGNDTINALAGNDVVYGGKGAASVSADSITGGDGRDTVYGGAGNDSINGDAGTDVLYGGDDNDVIDGGAGNDSIYGGTGDDTLTGGAGADRFSFGASHGDDVITDFSAEDDLLVLANTVTDFASAADVQAAATATTVDGATGVLINTGGGDSVFLVGLTVGDLAGLSYGF